MNRDKTTVKYIRTLLLLGVDLLLLLTSHGVLGNLCGVKLGVMRRGA